MSCYRCELKDVAIAKLVKLIEWALGKKLPPFPSLLKPQKIEIETHINYLLGGKK